MLAKGKLEIYISKHPEMQRILKKLTVQQHRDPPNLKTIMVPKYPTPYVLSGLKETTN